MKGLLIIKLLLAGTVLFSACYYDAEEKLYPASECVNTNMSYDANIATILQANCYVCHSSSVNSGNVTLDNYNAVKTQANSGKLLGTIKHSSGYIPMPQNASMVNSCDVAKIEQWISDGAQNN
ncbi:MAG: hypothetical protein ABJC12_00720 [Saprospiraceae bacterium]